MSRVLPRICSLLLLALASLTRSDSITDQNEAEEFLRRYTEQAEVIIYASSLASWNYNTNITAHNQQKSVGFLTNRIMMNIGSVFVLFTSKRNSEEMTKH